MSRAAPPGSQTETPPRPPLVRISEERVLAGVCAGLAAHLGVPVTIARGGMLLLGFLGGAGVVLYVWFWIMVPSAEPDLVRPMRHSLTAPATGVTPGSPRFTRSGSDAASGPSALPSSVSEPTASDPSTPEPSAPEPHASDASTGVGPRAADRAVETPSRSRVPVAELLLGAALLIAGTGLGLAQLGIDVDLGILLPGMVVLVGVGLAWWQIADRNRPERHQLPRVFGALGLVAVGVLTFFTTAQQPSVFTVIAAALAVLAGVALALAPWALRVNRDLLAERAGRAREAERAEIAAHLHDSVLQTLAAIQQRSEPGSEAARLARGQERELREWLFRTADGDAPATREQLDLELRAHAERLEAGYPVRFEIVAVGSGTHSVVPEPIAAAAREAMLNAARHAGGDVSVYTELTPTQASIDITDRGPGLDLESLPDGRMGVRESILGRMERAGGSARIVPGPGGSGTSVRLTMPVTTEGDVGE